MSVKDVTATTTGSDRQVSVSYDFGDNLDQAVELFGAELVFNRYESAVTIDLQALIRRGIKAEKTDEEIQELTNAWKPGIKQVIRKSAQEKIKDAFGAMSEEDKKAMLEQLMSSLEAA